MCFSDGSCAEFGSNFSSSADVTIQDDDNIRTFIIRNKHTKFVQSESYKCSSVA
jgi:hypothetical protein